jgi:hypothetical protein
MFTSSFFLFSFFLPCRFAYPPPIFDFVKIKVRAANQEGYSPWSEVSSAFATLTDLSEPPPAPEWVVSGIEWMDLVVDM